jgi:hypothetical protein
MVSPNEVEFNLREIAPPSRNILLSVTTDAGWQAHQPVSNIQEDGRREAQSVPHTKDEEDKPDYPSSAWDTSRRG